MSKIFGGIFGRAERSIPGTSPTIVIDVQTYDMEYVRYTTITGVNGVGMQLQRYSPIAMKLSSMPLITALSRI